MLQVARLARNPLHDSADLVEAYVTGQRNADGSFKDRAGGSDLYYTVFGLECLLALKLDIDAARTAAYLESFGDGLDLDMVHAACLARGWACVGRDVLSAAQREKLAKHIESFRSGDGGYEAERGSAFGTIYGCFLALGAYQDLNLEMPGEKRMAGCIEALRSSDGGYANQRDLDMGTAPSTAAAVTLLKYLGREVPVDAGAWLLKCCHPEGGFFAMPLAPLPDLLSTATSLHALAALHVDFSHIREACLDFIDSLWTNQGSFHGHWEEEALDVEYTYYGLLALGHLSL